MRGLRSHLTYANVISTLCLFLILAGGAAYAADTIGSSDIIDESILSQDLKNGEVKSDEVLDFGLSNQDVGVLYANVKGNGVVAESSGGVTATHLAQGQYEVDFGHDISACAYAGIVGNPTGDVPAPVGYVSASERPGNAEVMFVKTAGTSGQIKNQSFHMVVAC
jgi:hypothetical protein